MYSSAEFLTKWRGASITAVLVAMLVTCLIPSAIGRTGSQMADWEHDWVALTVARNGTWGVATNANVTRAMIQAIRDCSKKSAAAGNDCGAEMTTVRAAWSLAYACGEYTFIANGDTSAEARLAAIERAIDLKEILGFELPACELVVAVGSDGHVEPTGAKREFLAIPKLER